MRIFFPEAQRVALLPDEPGQRPPLEPTIGVEINTRLADQLEKWCKTRGLEENSVVEEAIARLMHGEAQREALREIRFKHQHHKVNAA
jgi:hypothetical protein